MSDYQDHFFTRGPSPLARFTFFALIAVGVMIADHRFQALGAARFVVSAVLTPIEQVLAIPGAVVRQASTYFSDQQNLINENLMLRKQVVELTARGQQAELVLAERTQLDALKVASARLATEGLVAEIVRDARNPFARKVIVNQGRSQGVLPGQAVIDGNGVVGQVTAVGLTSAEVTLSTEKDQAAPVMVLRNGLRAIAVGTGSAGMIDVPYIPIGADVQVGDALVTSGIDGTYPAGLAVAKIVSVDRNPEFRFAKISAEPTAGVDRHRFVKVLTQGVLHDYPRPDIEPADNNPRATKPDAKRAAARKEE